MAVLLANIYYIDYTKKYSSYMYEMVVFGLVETIKVVILFHKMLTTVMCFRIFLEGSNRLNLNLLLCHALPEFILSCCSVILTTIGTSGIRNERSLCSINATSIS